MKAAPLFEIEPRESDVQALYEANGKDLKKARETLIQRTEERLKMFALICPEVAREIAEDREKVAEIRSKLTEKVIGQAEILGQLQSLAVERANLQQQRSVLEEQHRRAVEILSQPSALDLTGHEPARLNAEREHLPSKIKELQIAADKIAAELKRLCKAGRFVYEAILIEMQKGADRPAGRPYHNDQHLFQLLSEGFAKV